ncbi:hypothetical protein CXB51_035059 [Gossypium anomalum]|uniref:Uncharacterized protein n=1 Tax=Gossypium anomalum TaxID=47600 RepID=A0A8J5XNI7_9ROSI|nr:hypothetical protein CXB51_035059 [Gossypium anomalum]
MAAPPARARADYDYLIKLLLIGDSGVGKSCLLLRFSDGSFTTSFITTIGVCLLPQFSLAHSITSYYRGAMGILLVYDVTDESSFNNIRNWIRNIEQHASDNVNKVLVANKADMDESKRAVPTSKGQALADEYGIKFFETSAKTNLNVEEVFFSIARDIKQRLADSDSKAGVFQTQSKLTNKIRQQGLQQMLQNQVAAVELRSMMSSEGYIFFSRELFEFGKTVIIFFVFVISAYLFCIYYSFGVKS